MQLPRFLRAGLNLPARRPRGAALVLLAVATLVAHKAAAQDRTPILVELFTSEGCSSCPPVDAWLEQLDKAQPVPGAQLIVLSEHVDYWDHDGWKDPWSSAQLTQRQRAYGQMLGLSDIYTPQVILDGNLEVHPWQQQQVKQSFARLAETAEVPVQLDAQPVVNGILDGRIHIDGAGQKHSGQVFVAVALDHAASQVESGENNGRHLTHVAVVRTLVRVGKLEKGKNLDQPFQIKLWPGADRDNIRVVAFVQEEGPGKIWGAAMLKGIGAAPEAPAHVETASSSAE